MSAFVVSKEHIDVLVKAGLQYRYACRIQGSDLSWYVGDIEGGELDVRREITRATAVRIGQMLWDENVKSVEYRYPDSAPSGDLPGPCNREWQLPYVYTDPGFNPTPGEVFKTIDCFAYEPCEHPGWEDSEAQRYCDVLRHAYCSLTPGYDDTPWGWDAEDVVKRTGGRPDVAVSIFELGGGR